MAANFPFVETSFFASSPSKKSNAPAGCSSSLTLLPRTGISVRIKLSLSFRRALTKTGCLYGIKVDILTKILRGQLFHDSGLIWLCLWIERGVVTGLAPDEFALDFAIYGYQQTHDSRLGSSPIKELSKRKTTEEQTLKRASNGEIKSLYAKYRTETCVQSKIRYSDLAEKPPIICPCLSYSVRRGVFLT